MSEGATYFFCVVSFGVVKISDGGVGFGVTGALPQVMGVATQYFSLD